MMNAIQSGNISVKEPFPIRETPVRSSVPIDNKLERNELIQQKGNGQRFDLSKLSEEDKAMFEEELQKHNEKFAYTGKVLKFRYDEEAEMSYVEVINSATNEIIVTLPPEFLIDLSIKMKKIIGMYIDERL